MPGHTHVLNEEQVTAIATRNGNGEYLFALAQEFKVSHDTVVKALKRAGFEPIKHKQQGTKPTVDAELQSTLAAEYVAGATLAQLMEKHSLGRKAVQNAIAREGVTFRPQGTGAQELSVANKNRVLEMHDEGLSTVAIAMALHTSQPKVKKYLESVGREIKSTRTGVANVEWTPRRRIGPGGYVKIKLHKDDPYYYLASDVDYILEHRYVMMNHLGRALTSRESVHHINGDKQDNRIENLQLRSSYHGKGQKYKCGDCHSHNIIAIEI